MLNFLTLSTEAPEGRFLFIESSLTMGNSHTIVKLNGETYIPLRKTTPNILIEHARKYVDNVENYPMIMAAKKVQQALEEDDGNNYGPRPHNYTIDSFVEFGNSKEPTLLNGYEGGVYNISVTTYDPDSLDKYLNKEGHLIIYDKQKNGESRSNSSSSVLSLSNDSPFTLSITESAESGKSNDEIPESPQINYSV